MKKKIICILQARVGSRRLPRKILFKVFNKTLLEHQLARLKKLKVDELIVATTKKKEDNQICKICRNNGVKFFRGESNNVLKRFYDCAKKNKPDSIIRITADCPIIDTKYIEILVNNFKKRKIDYMNNVDTNYLPDGFHSEIFKFSSLKKSYKLAKSNFDRQHVTPFMWSNPNLFSIFQLIGKRPKYHTKRIRLTLDYLEDYLLIKKIFENLYKKNKFFSLNNILHFLKKNKKLLNINKKYHDLQNKRFHIRRRKYINTIKL